MESKDFNVKRAYADDTVKEAFDLAVNHGLGNLTTEEYNLIESMLVLFKENRDGFVSNLLMHCDTNAEDDYRRSHGQKESKLDFFANAFSEFFFDWARYDTDIGDAILPLINGDAIRPAGLVLGALLSVITEKSKSYSEDITEGLTESIRTDKSLFKEGQA